MNNLQDFTKALNEGDDKYLEQYVESDANKEVNMQEVDKEIDDYYYFDGKLEKDKDDEDFHRLLDLMEMSGV